jgi:uncharacterized protein YndB with AHSA1/START domain/GNAT superfamily N-acetyltransferase
MSTEITKTTPESEIVTTRILQFPIELVFEAWENPKHLKNWWGPKGFSNTFNEFNFTVGGKWSFIMHGPEAGNYPNEVEFIKIDKPNLIAWKRHSKPLFQILTTFEALTEQSTKVVFKMLFDTPEESNKLRPFVVDKNEENFDKLEIELARMKYTFRKATVLDSDQIWEILQGAIERRKIDGSTQWQDGYPNEDVVRIDIDKGVGYVLTDGKAIVGYTAIIFNDEPAYEDLNGTWLSNGDFVVVHRLAISDEYIGKGLAQKIMQFAEHVAIENNTFSIKVDTNFDNIPMLKIFEKLGYTYCGEVSFRGSLRKAFEKELPKH